jgi:hypothetical protein
MIRSGNTIATLRSRLVIAATILSVAATGAAGELDTQVQSCIEAGIQIDFCLQAVPATFSSGQPLVKRATGSGEWAELIDGYWGDGLTTSEKLEVFDHFWQKVDEKFACFEDLDVDWAGLRAQYRSEVISGVSRGRFTAIMNRMSLALMEAHTRAIDRRVLYETALEPGVPVMVVGGWGHDRHFGAGLTPQPDGSALVYQVVEDHPLGLVPGDIVLGYDGRPWQELYPELLAMGLPVRGVWGSSPETFEHTWLMAAGMNWHLFDIIDILKYDTGEVVHLPTSLLEDQQLYIWNSEQLDIPGVAKPDYNGSNDHFVSWGIIEGTSIGYIYCWGWALFTSYQFRDAVWELMFDHETSGLIIDFRFNMGGGMGYSNKGLALLFNSVVDTIGFHKRCQDGGHLDMCYNPWGTPEGYSIYGDPESFYDRPIAVLTGPGAVSSGDQVALRMKFHPNARFFGKSTNTAFNSPSFPYSYNDDWYEIVATSDAYLISDPENHLTHDPFLVDEPVWLTPWDVAHGRDTVVEAAMRWIRCQYPDRPRRGQRRSGH